MSTRVRLLMDFLAGAGAVAALALAPTPAGAQTCNGSIETFPNAGTFSTTVPANCNTATVELWGAGGGGGAFRQNGQNRGGGGGGGGAFGRRVITSLSPGATISLTVGQGGSGGQFVNDSAWHPGAPGGTSSFGAYLSVTGGAGGAAGATTNAAGGSCTGAIVCHQGGTGGLGIASPSCGDYSNAGGGGGGGGRDGAGGNGGNATNNSCSGTPVGGTAGAGGLNGGGTGARGQYSTIAPTAPGGGGSGGCGASGGCAPGLAGADGRVIVTWSYTTPPPPSTWMNNGSSLYYTAGHVGIGTDTPENKLQVRGTDGDTSEVLVNIRKDGTAGGNVFVTSINPLNRAVSLFTDGGNGVPRLSLGAGPGGPEHVTIQSSGNVGIGTTTPTARLQVEGNSVINGNVTVSGNIAAKYQDVAEWVDSDADLPAATVVIADPNHPNRVTASRTAYDTSVVGVVSAQPGVLLGDAGAGKVMVAQSGRVRIKADTSGGAIRPGDLLVTSATAGYAMRSVPVGVGGVEIHRPGTIVGKALEKLDEGRGEILVLLTLQ